MTDGLGPSFIKLYYENPVSTHVATIPVNLVAGGPPGGTFELFTKNNAQVDWVVGITALVNAIKPLMFTSTTFQYAELYEQDQISGLVTFLSSTVLSIAGTSAAAQVNASQVVYSIRSSLGGKGFLYLMDASLAVNQKLRAPSYGTANQLAVVTYLIGVNSIFICRDNGYPVVVTKLITKTNDALRRKYGLS